MAAKSFTRRDGKVLESTSILQSVLTCILMCSILENTPVGKNNENVSKNPYQNVSPLYPQTDSTPSVIS